MLRVLIIAGFVFAMLTLGGCGVVRGAKDVETEPPSEGIGTGAGVVTGKRGGIVIFQK